VTSGLQHCIFLPITATNSNTNYIMDIGSGPLRIITNMMKSNLHEEVEWYLHPIGNYFTQNPINCLKCLDSVSLIEFKKYCLWICIRPDVKRSNRVVVWSSIMFLHKSKYCVNKKVLQCISTRFLMRWGFLHQRKNKLFENLACYDFKNAFERSLMLSQAKIR